LKRNEVLKMKKKISAVLLIFVLCFAMAACGQDVAAAEEG